MISASAAWSTSVTKSLRPLEVTVRDSRRLRLRMITSPARRAARTAILRSGCTVTKLVWSRAPVGLLVQRRRPVKASVTDELARHSRRTGRALAPRQHRRRGACHEKHGAERAGAGAPQA